MENIENKQELEKQINETVLEMAKDPKNTEIYPQTVTFIPANAGL